MNKKILLVDDEAYAMQSMMEHLSVEGFDVESATDPSLALDALKNSPFDAVIVDCVMATGHQYLDSRQAGAALIKEIRSGSPTVIAENKDVPILVLTAVCDQRILKDLSDSDVQFVIQKPVSTYDLLQKLSSVIDDGK